MAAAGALAPWTCGEATWRSERWHGGIWRRDAGSGSAPDAGARDAGERDTGPPSFVLLLVHDVSRPYPGEAMLRDRLIAAGHRVEARHVLDVPIGLARAAAAIVVAEGPRFANDFLVLAALPVPILAFDTDVYEMLGLSGPTAESDFGLIATTAATMENPGHPLAAGLAGEVALTRTPRPLGWSAVTVAQVVATVRVAPPTDAAPVADQKFVRELADADAGAGGDVYAGDPLMRAFYFAYPAGARVSGLPMPAARVALGIAGRLWADATSDAWRLFDAAVAWAIANPRV